MPQSHHAARGDADKLSDGVCGLCESLFPKGGTVRAPTPFVKGIRSQQVGILEQDTVSAVGSNPRLHALSGRGRNGMSELKLLIAILVMAVVALPIWLLSNRIAQWVLPNSCG